jgi:hypothetical protein
MPKIDVSKVPGTVDVSSMMNDVKKSMPNMLSEIKSGDSRSGASSFKMPSMDQISFGPDGMPRITAKPQATAMANAAAAEKQATKSSTRTENTAGNQQSTATETGATVQSSTSNIVAKSTLDDVVSSLNSLNTTMRQVLSTTNQTNSLVERQVKVTKAIGGNVYDRLA